MDSTTEEVENSGYLQYKMVANFAIFPTIELSQRAEMPFPDVAWSLVRLRDGWFVRNI